MTLPFALVITGCDIDTSHEFARQYNPVDEIQGAIPGVGDMRSDTFTGLWHFEAVDADINRFNSTRGMWYPGAGPSYPGAFDVTIMAGTQVAGLALNAFESDGPTHYGDFDRIHRTGAMWQSHSIGMLEFSPLHNLAAYGWSLFQADPTDAVGLGWPLHAVGDACEPHHVTSTSAWGHRPYEDFIGGNDENFMPRAFDSAGVASGHVPWFRWR